MRVDQEAKDFIDDMAFNIAELIENDDVPSLALINKLQLALLASKVGYDTTIDGNEVSEEKINFEIIKERS